MPSEYDNAALIHISAITENVVVEYGGEDANVVCLNGDPKLAVWGEGFRNSIEEATHGQTGFWIVEWDNPSDNIGPDDPREFNVRRLLMGDWHKLHNGESLVV